MFGAIDNGWECWSRTNELGRIYIFALFLFQYSESTMTWKWGTMSSDRFDICLSKLNRRKGKTFICHRGKLGSHVFSLNEVFTRDSLWVTNNLESASVLSFLKASGWFTFTTKNNFELCSFILKFKVRKSLEFLFESVSLC